MEHIIKVIEDIKKSQIENIELNNIITKIRNSLDGDDKESLKLRLHHWKLEIVQSEQPKENRF